MFSNLIQKIKDKSRMGQMAALAAAGTAFVFWVAPNQLEVMLYKVALISGFAYLGYWIDRTAFPYGRPHEEWAISEEDDTALYRAAMLRRAVIIGATVIAGGIAL